MKMSQPDDDLDEDYLVSFLRSSRELREEHDRVNQKTWLYIAIIAAILVLYFLVLFH